MIQLLDKATIDKIAAGEVIERPSSVVKELLENSIDAHATAITVEIKDGGTSLIRVTDNGDGIEKEDIKKAYMRHATSKITSVEDLDSIGSLGFRGEALSTIAAVSQTEMITKTSMDVTGVRYEIHGGQEIDYKEVGVPNGTTIVVRNLFYNTPARKKFLKSNMTEGSYILDLITKIALSHPEISFKMIANGQTKIDTSGSGKLKDTIYQLYGRDITANLIPVFYEKDDIRISGFIGKPFIARGNRGLENYFINHRYIKSNVVNRAIEEGYRTFVMQHKFPFTVLFLDLPQEQCDVNVHPTKMEFKYHNEKLLFEVCCSAVKEALTHKEIIPKDQERKVAAPVINKPKEKPAEPYEQARNIPKPNGRVASYSPSYKILESLKAAEDGSKPDLTPLLKEDGVKYEPQQTTKKPLDIPRKQTDEQEYTSRESIPVKPEIPQTQKQETIVESHKAESKKQEETPTVEEKKRTVGITYNKQKMVQTSMFDDDFLTQKARINHRVIGQVFDTYWLIEYGQQLYIMDQHAAHEKVKFEELMENLKNKQVYSQQLMPPMVVTVTYTERQAILEHYDLFMKIGYDITEFGGNEFKINAIPSNLFGIHGREMFMEFVGSLIQNSGYMSNDLFVKKLSTMACKAAIKGNMKMSFQEADALLDRLLELDNPYTCPHGRPTIISMSKTELEKKFQRIVS